MSECKHKFYIIGKWEAEGLNSIMVLCEKCGTSDSITPNNPEYQDYLKRYPCKRCHGTHTCNGYCVLAINEREKT